MRRRGRGLRGHSLLEAMLAGSILLAGLAGVVTALTGGMRIQAHSQRLTTGVHLAEETMERLLLLPEGHALLGSGDHTGDRVNIHGQTDGSGAFEPKWTVGAGPLSGSLTLTVVVEWHERDRMRSVTLRSYR